MLSTDAREQETIEPLKGIVILTFDIEDFINHISIIAIKKILLLLKKYSLKSVFFITGHMAEKLERFPSIVQLLTDHEIGYHSTSHSIRPIIPEYTDKKSYSIAIKNSFQRETAHINPVSGEIEGVGGIKILREIFPNKNINSFRAPGFCWTPPHLEALKKLGIKHNFSSVIQGTNISSSDILFFKGIKFFPYPCFITYTGNNSIFMWGYQSSKLLFKILITEHATCLIGHEWDFVLSKQWDSIYMKSNPQQIQKTKTLKNKEIFKKFYYFETLLKLLNKLHKRNLICITPNMDILNTRIIDAKDVNILRTYQHAMEWSIKYMNYKPKYQIHHFYKFFK